MSGLVVRALLVLLAVGGWLAASSAGDRAVAAGAWTWPVAGAEAVSRPFAPPAHRYGPGHRGVDLHAPPGAAVRAAGAGRVSYAGLLAGRGVVVVVHGALRTTYEPVSATVALGETVAVGEVIGRLEAGHAGCPAAACLHWGLRRGDDYLDPTRLVERGSVRLLPVGPRPAGAGGATLDSAAQTADVGDGPGRRGLSAARAASAGQPGQAGRPASSTAARPPAEQPGRGPVTAAGAVTAVVTLAAGAVSLTAGAVALAPGRRPRRGIAGSAAAAGQRRPRSR